MAGVAGIHDFLDGDGGFDDEIVENSGECDEATEDGLLQHCNLNNVVNDHLGMIVLPFVNLRKGSIFMRLMIFFFWFFYSQ